jgi:hypothetical protein
MYQLYEEAQGKLKWRFTSFNEQEVLQERKRLLFFDPLRQYWIYKREVF